MKRQFDNYRLKWWVVVEINENNKLKAMDRM